MNRVGTDSEFIREPTWTPTGQADTWMRATVTVTVAGLAGIAGAISYSHMRNLAAVHGETGWQAHAFPLSVDGIEIVASLAHHMIVRRADVTVSQLAVVLGKLLRPDGSEVDDQEQ
jgi:hypothetical protein